MGNLPLSLTLCLILIQISDILSPGFLDYIVSPSFDVCGDMLELLLSRPLSPSSDCDPVPIDTSDLRVWAEPISENRKMWKARSEKKGE